MATTTTPRPTRDAVDAANKGARPRMLILAGVILAALVALIVFAAVSGSESAAELEATALEELVAQETEVLDFYFAQSDSSTYVGMYADSDVTYIDPSSGGVLADQAAKDYLLSFTGFIPPFTYEIVDPAVNLSGDTAIFTFNVEMFDGGAPVGVWNTTQIHQRAGNGWEMIHAHWSNPAPTPEG
ncbi:MAG: nuclear transport factor 2 family protein [Acidimicrobiia bacterium]|nr:nuclear transport factor 2 family protein [Acidimicrobiia bacterium]